jgi:hypothetical protein
MSCSSCMPSMPEDQQLKAAIEKANEQSIQNKEPVAIYKEGGEFKLCNAFTAYANHYAVCKVVSPYNRTAAE